MGNADMGVAVVADRASNASWQTVERRIGRFGRRAPLVSFLHARGCASDVDGFDADGNPYPLLRVDAHTSLRRERVTVNYRDGRTCVEFGERAEFRPWSARPVVDASGCDLVALRVDAASVWFRTRWTVQNTDGSTMFTITEPLRDGLLRRYVRGPLKALAGAGSLADEHLNVLLLPLLVVLVPIVFAPLLLIKRRFRLIISDTHQRIGVIEHRTLQTHPRNDFTVLLDIAVVTDTDPRTLIAATMGAMIGCWA